MLGNFWWVMPILIVIILTFRYYYINHSKKHYLISSHLDKRDTESVRQKLLEDYTKKDGEAYLGMIFSLWFLLGCVIGHFI